MNFLIDCKNVYEIDKEPPVGVRNQAIIILAQVLALSAKYEGSAH